MNLIAPPSTLTRSYRQGVRAEAAEATRRAIMEAFLRQARDRWFDEVTLDGVARDAGVTVQTVLRRFGNKEGLLDATAKQLEGEIVARRVTRPGDLEPALRSLVEDYEIVGDLLFRLLAQEERHPVLKPFLDLGRSQHRFWIGEVFKPWLDPLPLDERGERTSALVAAWDLYTWKLLRRDLGHPRAEVTRIMQSLADGLVGARTST